MAASQQHKADNQPLATHPYDDPGSSWKIWHVSEIKNAKKRFKHLEMFRLQKKQKLRSHHCQDQGRLHMGEWKQLLSG